MFWQPQELACVKRFFNSLLDYGIIVSKNGKAARKDRTIIKRQDFEVWHWSGDCYSLLIKGRQLI